MPKLRYELEPLKPLHPVSTFGCEDDYFNEYLQSEAMNDVRLGLAQTFVEVDHSQPTAKNIAGYFTLRAHSAQISDDYFDDAANQSAENAGPVHASPIEVPLIELMYLARDSYWRGRGLGDALLLDALRIVGPASRWIGFIGLHLRSTPAGVRLYQRFNFSQFDEHVLADGMRFILPRQDILEIVDASFPYESPTDHSA